MAYGAGDSMRTARHIAGKKVRFPLECWSYIRVIRLFVSNLNTYVLVRIVTIPTTPILGDVDAGNGILPEGGT